MDSEIKIECHGDTSQGGIFNLGQPTWRDPQGVTADGHQGSPFRTCSYCGSIHPEDLLKAIKAGARMHGSDWKYGWPHKFYVEDIPNPVAGQKVRTISGGGYKTKEEALERASEYDKPENEIFAQQKDKYWEFVVLTPASEKTHGKWYNTHLKDLNDADFAEMSEALKVEAGIEFQRDEKGIKYRAPQPGYQK